jgi:hypothetical protein
MSKAEKLSGFDFARLADVRALKSGLLYPYQSDGVAFLLSKKRAVLGDDMGLGKTRQAIISMQMGTPEGKVLKPHKAVHSDVRSGRDHCPALGGRSAHGRSLAGSLRAGRPQAGSAPHRHSEAQGSLQANLVGETP